MADTIYGLSTLYGKSGLAVIRICGNQSLKILSLLTKKKNITPRVVTLCNIIDPKSEELIDQGLVIYFPAPNSFTGEDVIELHIHGSLAIINAIISILSEINEIRIAEPGEFSKRAFLNGKMDLTRAEGLAFLIDAETAVQRRIAMGQYQGKLEGIYEAWRKTLIKILSQIEALVDFPEEDIPIELLNSALQQVINLKKEILLHLDDNRRGEILINGIKVAIVGPPNVGKSSLINYISNRDIAIISDIPGTTRDALEIKLDIEGFPFVFIDTAGIRAGTDDSIEAEGIKRSLMRMKEANIKMIVIDMYNLKFLKEIEPHIDAEDNLILLFNKTDLGFFEHIELMRQVKLLGIKDNVIDKIENNLCIISVKERINLEEIYSILLKTAKSYYSPNENPIITKNRYRKALQNAINALEQFNLDIELELAIEHIRVAAADLSYITGKIDVEEILDEIFSSFCIGK